MSEVGYWRKQDTLEKRTECVSDFFLKSSLKIQKRMLTSMLENPLNKLKSVWEHVVDY